MQRTTKARPPGLVEFSPAIQVNDRYWCKRSRKVRRVVRVAREGDLLHIWTVVDTPEVTA